MIHYQLRCSEDHEFDGWFRDSAAFDRQAVAGLVQCPSCGTASVHRALMAPRIARKGRTVDPAGQEQPPPVPVAPEPKVATELPDQLRGMLQKLRAEVEKSCENVGDQFAAEARAIHDGKAASRPIYGDATPEQAEALAEDGIPIQRIPWVPREDA